VRRKKREKRGGGEEPSAGDHPAQNLQAKVSREGEKRRGKKKKRVFTPSSAAVHQPRRKGEEKKDVASGGLPGRQSAPLQITFGKKEGKGGRNQENMVPAPHLVELVGGVTLRNLQSSKEEERGRRRKRVKRRSGLPGGPGAWGRGKGEEKASENLDVLDRELEVLYVL